MLADALTASAIARRLGISVATVHKHVESLYRKLGTRDRVSTVLRAQEMGLLPRRGGR
ncbi:response regulator transcription factor [Streptomyces prunicolor]|uniref:response regulator transcription factor n=1 Tax=Streptomyces prunicolor TaxID=67348 RepID=UPI00386EA839